MSRARPTPPPEPQPRLPADPLLLEVELADWAGASVAASGRKDALLGRVERLVLAPDGRAIDARVRGNRPLPYRVQVDAARGALRPTCTCGREPDTACRHAVAALEALRFPLRWAPDRAARPRSRGARARPAGRGRGGGRIIQRGLETPGFVVLGAVERTLTRDERLAIARGDELTARKQRARRLRARVEPCGEAGGPLRFLVTPAAGEARTVTLRGPRGRHAACACEDFARNELQTCAHVERVRTWFLRKKKVFPERLLSLWWCPREWQESAADPLREIRADVPEDTMPDDLAPFFEPDGWLRACPITRRRAEWAADARDAAVAEAARRDWDLDFDERLDPLLERAALDDRRSLRLQSIDAADPAWREIRDALGFRLHPYQERGTLFLARTGRAFLADDMGLGKTVQAIAAALLLRRIGGATKALVVCPASLKHQWRKEIEKACGERATVVDGARAGRLRAYRDWGSGFLILNYELVLRDLEAIRAARADVVLLDEAQRIKNWNTRTARAVKRLDSPFAFVLTGTPLENRLLELHSLAEFLHPRALGPRWRLLPYHAVTESEGRVIAYEGLGALRARLRGFFLRRERSAVLDQLPPRTDNTFWTAMAPSQRRPYRRQARQLATLLSGGQPLRPQEVRLLLKLLTGMRIICNAYAQFDWSAFEERLADPAPPTAAELRAIGSPKLEEFARVLDDLLDQSETKVVVFSQWERMLRLAHFVVRDVLERRDQRAEVFHGGLSSRARGELLESFVADPELRVLFSTDAGGLGLNLQHSASIVVNLEVPWNPAVLEQRIGRVHRLGQRNSVQVLHFVTRHAIEERVRQVLEGKRALFDGLLVDGAEQVLLDDESRSTLVERVRGLVGDQA